MATMMSSAMPRSAQRVLLALGSGAVFGAGLSISGMTDTIACEQAPPAKVTLLK